jgi:vitamin B12 transporter
LDNRLKKLVLRFTVVTEAEIEARNEPNLLETLRNVEGLQVIQTGGPGRTTGMFLRGASPNQTLVMVDGIPVNEANSGLFDFADISTLSVGSVEIIRGPQSVMYGADAMGGVINIISKKNRRRTSE